MDSDYSYDQHPSSRIKLTVASGSGLRAERKTLLRAHTQKKLSFSEILGAPDLIRRNWHKKLNLQR